MNKPGKKLSVTAVIDERSKKVTAFFNELPALIVQGNDMDDVRTKLHSLLHSFIKRLQNVGNDFEITTKNLA